MSAPSASASSTALRRRPVGQLREPADAPHVGRAGGANRDPPRSPT